MGSYVVRLEATAYRSIVVDGINITSPEKAIEWAETSVGSLSAPVSAIEVTDNSSDSDDASPDCWEVFGRCEACSKFILLKNGEDPEVRPIEEGGYLCRNCFTEEDKKS